MGYVFFKKKVNNGRYIRIEDEIKKELVKTLRKRGIITTAVHIDVNRGYINISVCLGCERQSDTAPRGV